VQNRQGGSKYDFAQGKQARSRQRMAGWENSAARLPPTNLYECQRKGLTNLHFVSLDSKGCDFGCFVLAKPTWLPGKRKSGSTSAPLRVNKLPATCLLRDGGSKRSGSEKAGQKLRRLDSGQAQVSDDSLKATIACELNSLWQERLGSSRLSPLRAFRLERAYKASASPFFPEISLILASMNSWFRCFSDCSLRRWNLSFRPATNRWPRPHPAARPPGFG